MEALVVIDMQRGMFRTDGRAEQLINLVPKINGLVRQFIKFQSPVFVVHTGHKPDRSTWSRLMLKYDHACMISNTPDVEAVDGLELPPVAHVISKTENSAFIRTGFENCLRKLNVEKVFLTGVFIDGCVGLTAADAEQRGFEVVLVKDAIGHIFLPHRSVILDWLRSMYEMSVVVAADVACGGPRAKETDTGT